MFHEYLSAALGRAVFETLPDDEGIWAEIPGFDGVWANAPTTEACAQELAAALEDWILVGLRLGHELPDLDGLRLPTPEIV